MIARRYRLIDNHKPSNRNSGSITRVLGSELVTVLVAGAAPNNDDRSAASRESLLGEEYFSRCLRANVGFYGFFFLSAMVCCPFHSHSLFSYPYMRHREPRNGCILCTRYSICRFGEEGVVYETLRICRLPKLIGAQNAKFIDPVLSG